MFELKTLEEIEEAINMLSQETDASQKTKGKHLLIKQFRLALDKIDRLERTNQQLRSDAEQSPDYYQKQALSVITSYMDVFK